MRAAEMMTDTSPNIPAEEWFGPNSRYSLHQAPILAPGICIVCKTGSTDERTFIDLGMSFKWYGRMYMCSLCISEIARGIGFGDPDKIAAIQTANEILGLSNIELRKQFEDLNESHRALARTVGNCSCSGGDSRDVRDSESSGDAEAGGIAEPNDSVDDESGGLEGSGSIHDDGIDEPGESEL